MKEKIEGQEDFILKKIRHYQGTIQDYETFWNQRIAQDASEISPETKACQAANDNLNKAFEIVPVSKDDDTPKPITPSEVKNEEDKEKKIKKDGEKEEKKEKKVEKEEKKEKVEKEDSKDDKKKKDKE